jgi:hypothetical protein
MSCRAKHTAYQPLDQEFRCLYCGKGPEQGGLIIEGNDEVETDANCVLLHPGDYFRCYNPECNRDITGKAFAARLAKLHDLIPCPTCGGKGTVFSKKGKGKK